MTVRKDHAKLGCRKIMRLEEGKFSKKQIAHCISNFLCISNLAWFQGMIVRSLKVCSGGSGSLFLKLARDFSVLLGISRDLISLIQNHKTYVMIPVMRSIMIYTLLCGENMGKHVHNT